MKRAKYYLSVICLLLFMVNCAVDGGNGKSQEETATEVSDSGEVTNIDVPSMSEWPIGGGSLRNNSHYSVYCRYDKNGTTSRVYCPPYTNANSYFGTSDIDYFREPATGTNYKINGFGRAVIGSDGRISSSFNISVVSGF